jgi:glycosyltransferase involved in cell wall biosynthesis
MRVLLVNDVARPIGGAEIFTLGLRDELRARGHDARILATSAYLNGAVSPADFTCFGTTSRLRTANRTVNLDARRALRRVLAEFRPDVVHVRMFLTQLSPLILPLLRSVPSIYHASFYETVCPTGLKLLPDGSACAQPAGRACRRCLSPQAWTVLMLQRRMWARWRDVFDLVVANSDTMRRQLQAHGIGPIVRVYNGVPRRDPRPPLADPPTIAYAGRLAREKGVDVLVDAFASVARAHPKARLLLVGDGPERPRLDRLVATAGLAARVTFTGLLTRAETEAALDRAWVQVVPSRLEEPFGNAAAEALMRGTALVASDVGGLAEIVRRGETGMLVPPQDTAALATALFQLVGDRERAERLGEAGREWALDWLGRDACVDRFEELYRALVAGAAA